jgi:hypothetical protein
VASVHLPSSTENQVDSHVLDSIHGGREKGKGIGHLHATVASAPTDERVSKRIPPQKPMGIGLLKIIKTK